MTPEDIATLKQIDPIGAAETEREYMRHGKDEIRTSNPAATIILIIVALAVSVYALPWAFKFAIKLIGGLF
jgi:hypothetical protein